MPGEHRLVLETRGDSVALICEKCSRPFLTIKGGEAEILNKHGKEQHPNKLTEHDLKMVLALIEAQRRAASPPQEW